MKVEVGEEVRVIGEGVVILGQGLFLFCYKI